LPPEAFIVLGGMPSEMVGGMAPEAFAGLPPQSFEVLGGVPPEVFAALPPEVFGFGFGLLEGPPEFLGDAGLAANGFQDNADQLILDNQAARGGAESALAAANTPEATQAAQENLDRLDALDVVGARMSDAADDLAAAVSQAEGFGAQIQTFDAQHDQAKVALNAAQAEFSAAPTPAGQTALDAAQLQADAAAGALAEIQSTASVAAAEVTVAEAQGSLATAEIAVLEAQIPIELVAAQIALVEAEEGLAAKQGALVSLAAAAE
jgi:hypothetical protein